MISRLIVMVYLVCILSFALSAVPFPQAPPCSLGLPGECTTSVFHELTQAVGQYLVGQATEFGKMLGREKIDVQAKLDKVRPRVYGGSLRGTELQNAQAELAKALNEKDYYLCMVDGMFAPGNGPLAASNEGLAQLGIMNNYKIFTGLDGDIPEMAKERFNNWCGIVVDHFKLGLFEINAPTILKRYDTALQSGLDRYVRYQIARDWVEFESHGRNLTTDPKQYAINLIAFGGPWERSGNLNNREDIVKRANEYYEEMANTFGQANVDKAAKKIMEAKKNGSGLTPAMNMNGVLYGHPWTAFWGAIGETNLRNYELVQIAFFPTGSGSDIYIDDLTKAVETYKELAGAAGGEAAFLKVVGRVHDAPKRGNGRLEDARTIGATNDIPKRAIDSIVSHAGGAGAAGGGSNAAMVDNPDFQGWQHQKLGATAVYSEDRGFKHMRDIWSLTLKSLDSQGATVIQKSGEIESSAPLELREGPIAVPARLALAQEQGTGANSKGGGKRVLSSSNTDGEIAPATYQRPSETGTETLKVNGKVFECHWEKRGEVIVWRNNDVPGGMVLRFNHDYQVYQPQLASAAAAHSMSDIRYEVESLSDGPYRRAQTPPPSAPAPARVASAAAGVAAVPKGGSTRTAASVVTPIAAAPPSANDLAGVYVNVETVEIISIAGMEAGTLFKAQTVGPAYKSGRIVVPEKTEVYLKATIGHSTPTIVEVRLSIDHLVLNGKVVTVGSNDSTATVHSRPTSAYGQEVPPWSIPRSRRMVFGLGPAAHR